jgi:hypothetical protein
MNSYRDEGAEVMTTDGWEFRLSQGELTITDTENSDVQIRLGTDTLSALQEFLYLHKRLRLWSKTAHEIWSAAIEWEP